MDELTPRLTGLLDWLQANSEALLLGTLVAFVLVAIMLGLREVGRQITSRDPNCTTWRSVIGRILAKTSLAFMVFAALDIVTTFAEPHPRIGRIFDILFIIAFALQAAVWGRELILGVIGRKVRDDSGESTLANAMSLIKVLVSVALFAIAFIVILDNVGVNVTALVAGLGIGGIAIGLAAQGIFSDLFAALAILFDKPFRRGDTIRYDQSVGTVERIGLKTTRLRSLAGEQLVMANTKLLEREIQNFAAGHSRRTTLLFSLVYHSSPDLLEQVPELARGVVEGRDGCTFVRSAITGLGPSSIDFELLYDSATLDPDMVGADRTAIVIELLRTLAAHKLEFAYPTQTTYTAAPGGELVMPYAQHPGVSASNDHADDKA